MSIDFDYDDSRIYVPVRIGGLPDRWFILDTGASNIVIDRALATELGLALAGDDIASGAGAGSTRVQSTDKLSLNVGAVPLTVDSARVIDLAAILGPTSGRRPAGIIGIQFFREHFVAIDFEHRQLTVSDPDADHASSYSESVPLEFSDGLPLARLLLVLPDGETLAAKALVDLGAKSTLLLPEPFVERHNLRTRFKHGVTAGLGAGLGGDTYYSFARARALMFDGQPETSLDAPVVGLSVGGTLRSEWHEGLLGADFLSRFDLGIDLRHSRLLLDRRSAQAEPFDRSGLTLVASGPDLRTITVRQVVPGGAGESAGMAVGDEILSIDGKQVTALGLGNSRVLLRSRMETVEMVVRRGRETRTIVLPLNDLL